MPYSRFNFRFGAYVLRGLMECGMFLDKLRTPRPLSPALRQKISTTISHFDGEIELLVYAPSKWRPNDPGGQKFPVLVNFHAGGFTIGRASDDYRWATTVVGVADAVVVSVQYRLAPEYPFPTAIEDGVDALLYLFRNAERLNLDASRLGLSGFSSGGSMAFTVWLRFQAELERYKNNKYFINSLSTSYRASLIVSWYPSIDFATHTRTDRRRTNPRPDKEVPRFLIDFFDACYLYPPSSILVSDPLLSPGIAPESMLKSLPEDIIICACEWDGLRNEAERFAERLTRDIGKRVRYKVVQEASHAWDKKLGHIGRIPPREDIYRDVSVEIRRVFSRL